MSTNNLEIARRFDSRGMNCPMPIVRTAQEMKTLKTGELLEVLAYQAKSVSDFTAWAKTTGNPLVESSVENGVYRFVFRKR